MCVMEHMDSHVTMYTSQRRDPNITSNGVTRLTSRSNYKARLLCFGNILTDETSEYSELFLLSWLHISAERPHLQSFHNHEIVTVRRHIISFSASIFDH